MISLHENVLAVFWHNGGVTALRALFGADAFPSSNVVFGGIIGHFIVTRCGCFKCLVLQLVVLLPNDTPMLLIWLF